MRLPCIAALLLAVAVAGCGSDAGAAASGATVRTKSVAGSGTVLVDASGAALYTPAGGAVCAGACAKVWIPLAAGTGTPTAADGVSGKVATVHRADGSRQVTFDGKPLYTFVQDAAGKVTGDGASDTFGGQAFTWQVIRIKGSAKPKPKPAGGGYSY